MEWSEQAAEHVRSRRVRGGGRDIEPEWATEAVFDSKRLIAIAQADSPNAALVIVGISDSFGGLLKDDEIAAVISYVRQSFGNNASIVTPDQVKAVRDATKDRLQFYMVDEILKEHPIGK